MRPGSADWEAYWELRADTGEPQCQLLNSGYHAARKPHACGSCRRTILPGCRYLSQFWLIDGAPSYVKTCLECLDEFYGFTPYGG